MSIYRFKSKLATQDRLEAFSVAPPGSGKSQYGPWIDSYEKLLEKKNKRSENFLFDYYVAPSIDETRYGLNLQCHFRKESKIRPDIWGVENHLIVSQKFKDVLDRFDSTPQYIPIDWIDQNQNVLQADQSYYWFDPKVFLRIIHGSRKLSYPKLSFVPLPQEEDFIGRLFDDSKLKAAIEKVLCWRHIAETEVAGRNSQARMVLYFNSELEAAFSDANLVGLEHYSKKYGCGEESVVRVTSSCEGFGTEESVVTV